MSIKCFASPDHVYTCRKHGVQKYNKDEGLLQNFLFLSGWFSGSSQVFFGGVNTVSVHPQIPFFRITLLLCQAIVHPYSETTRWSCLCPMKSACFARVLFRVWIMSKDICAVVKPKGFFFKSPVCYCNYKIWICAYGCFLKWWYPQNTPKWSFLVGKPMVVGYHHFRKHPYSDCISFGGVFTQGVFICLHVKSWGFPWSKIWSCLTKWVEHGLKPPN